MGMTKYDDEWCPHPQRYDIVDDQNWIGMTTTMMEHWDWDDNNLGAQVPPPTRPPILIIDDC